MLQSELSLPMLVERHPMLTLESDHALAVSPPKPRLLLVDDNTTLLSTLRMVLEHNGFEVVPAANVNEALKFIGSQTFDVLLSDLHMPQPGAGLTVVSAMRNTNPKAVTLIFSAYPRCSRPRRPC